ncbi:MAG: FG-GAP-like repeat-containing protein [Caldilineaceae bacterium]
MSHDLDHTTTVPGGDVVAGFDANGSGVAINDLDNDGDLDIVLANHADANTILWNEGGLTFRSERDASRGDSRFALIVDVDGDGWQDLFSSRVRPAHPPIGTTKGWAPMGAATFAAGAGRRQRAALQRVSKDLDMDGDLDFVGGTYDVGRLAQFGHEFLEQELAAFTFTPTRAGVLKPRAWP